MKKRDLVERLSYKYSEFEKEDLEYIVNSFFEVLKESLKKGDRIEFRDFGVLFLKKTKGIIFKNPRNSQNYYVKEKLRVLFRLGKEFKERLNSPCIASLDLGTQTFRLCVGKEYEGKVYYLIKDRVNVRLGEGLGINGKISKEAFKRGIEGLKKFKKILEGFEVEKYRAVGTAIFRKASNIDDFLKEAEKIGIKIEVISPEEEANLSLTGIKAGLERLGIGSNNFVCIDVGGGSTEVVCIKNGNKVWVKSLDLGAVVLKDIFGLRYPVHSKVLESVKNYVRECLKDLPKEEGEELVITGGSASLLGSLDLKLTKYIPERLHGHRITKERIDKLLKKLSNYDLARLSKVKGMESGREDIAVPGILIYSCLCDHFDKDSLVLSEEGILEGTLLSLIKEYNF